MTVSDSIVFGVHINVDTASSCRCVESGADVPADPRCQCGHDFYEFVGRAGLSSGSIDKVGSFFLVLAHSYSA